jgi:predicted metalloprotease with PDZ domain
MKRLLTAAFAAAALAPNAALAESFQYRLTPIVLADRTDFQVDVRWRAGGAQAVGMPRDCYGVPDFHRYVTVFEGRGGTHVAPNEGADARSVTPGRDGEISLRYRLSFDPDAMSHFPFGPNTGSTHFHIGGCQWMLRLGADDVEHDYDIRFEGRARGWRYYSSMSADPRRVRRTASYNAMNTTAFGGSSGPYHSFSVDGRPVRVFWSSSFGQGFSHLAEDVEAIVRGQRRAMGDNDFPFYTVAIWPRPDVRAGTAIDGLFVAFIRPDAERAAINRLLAHEMYHNWLSHRIAVAQIEGATRARFQWLHEGVNEYLSRRMLRDGGMMSEEELVELSNRDFNDIANNPYVADTLEELESTSRAGAWTNIHAKLSYARGAAIALRWEAELRREGRGGIVDLMRALHAGRGADAEEISAEHLFEVGRAHGLDIEGDYRRFIVEGAPIEAPHDAFPGWGLSSVSEPRFEPGFDVSMTHRSKVMTGVLDGGPAWSAGLREGMAISEIANAGRFSNAWEADAPLVVTLADGRRIEYMPRGALMALPRYVRQ